MAPRTPPHFNETQLEYLRTNYQPLQDREPLPYPTHPLLILAIYIVIWLLLGVFLPLLVEVFVGRAWIWQVKMSWGLIWMLVLLLAWRRGRAVGDMGREMGSKWEGQKRDRVSSCM